MEFKGRVGGGSAPERNFGLEWVAEYVVRDINRMECTGKTSVDVEPLFFVMYN